MPDPLLCHALPPDAAHLGNFAEDPATVNLSSFEPHLQFPDHPVWNRNGSDVPPFAEKVDNGPMVLPLLEMIKPQTDSLMPPKTAGKEKSQESPIPLSFNAIAIRRLPERMALLGGQPVSQADPELLYALDPPDTGCQIGA